MVPASLPLTRTLGLAVALSGFGFFLRVRLDGIGVCHGVVLLWMVAPELARGKRGGGPRGEVC